MTLSLYMARRFALTFGMVFGIFLSVMYLIELVDQVRRLSQADVGFAQIAALALLHVPAALYRVLPLVMILSAVALFLAMSRSSELVVMRAAGRSALRSLVPPVVTAVLTGALAVAVMNPIVAATTKRYEELSNRFRLGDGATMSVSSEGLWLRQGGSNGQTVIRAARSNLDGTVLSGVTFLDFAPDSGPVRRIEADRAELTPGAWRVTGAKVWQFRPGTNPEQAATSAETMTVPSDLTVDQIRDSFGTPESIAIWDLPGFIAALERAGFSARKHELWFQTELSLPLMLGAMVLVGAGFTMRHARFGKTGLMVLLAMGFGFAMFFIRNFAQILGENGQIPVALAAWSPPLAAVLFSVGLLLHLEDG